MKTFKLLIKNWSIWFILYFICSYILAKATIITFSDVRCVIAAFLFGAVTSFLVLAIVCDILSNCHD